MAKGTLSRKTRKPSLVKPRKRGPDARSLLFKEYFLNPASESYLKVGKSARRASYKENYARKLVENNPNWLQELKKEIIVSSEDLVWKAEKHFDEVLSIPNRQQVMGPFGPLWEGKGKKRKPIMGYNMGVVKQKNDVSKFVAEMLGGKKYRTKQDKSLPPLQTLIVLYGPDGTRKVIQSFPQTMASAELSGGSQDG